VDLVSVGEQVT